VRFSLDIETACGVPGCIDKQCDHALIPHLARITLISIWSPAFHKTFRSAADLWTYWLSRAPLELITHYGVFDLAVLHAHGCPIPLKHWGLDSQFMAAVSLTKIPAEYLAWYGAERKRLNETRTKPHRDAGQYSLKTLAPYFLGIEPFWEPEDHNDVSYNLKDTEYTYRLAELFETRLREEGLWGFYTTYQQRWARGLLRMSLHGAYVDLAGLKRAEEESAANAARCKAELDRLWASAYQALVDLRITIIHNKYDMMMERAYQKAIAAKKPPTLARIAKLEEKYEGLRAAALQKLDRTVNLGSPDQLAWILRDYFGLDITDWEDEESTAKAVIQKLIGEGRNDLRVFLEWRTEAKRLNAFYPTYWELMRPSPYPGLGTLHTMYNPTGARTGRISSGRPNLQQCFPGVRRHFVAPPGFELATFDESAVEPRLITYFTEDKVLFDLLARGDDFHGFNTKIFFGLECDVNEVKHLHTRERKVGKEAGLSILYGAGARRLQNIALKYGFAWSLDECKRKIAALRAAYRGVSTFKKALDERARTHPVTGYFGQKYAYPNPEDIYMKAFNTLQQGSASQVVVESACRIQDDFDAEGIPGGPILVVHDEIVALVPAGNARAVEIIKHRMTDWPLPTPHGNVALEVEGKVSGKWEK
jgi:DNA polymerase I-like protein with 3'-5' exonuclease and polymerase domains